VRNFELVYSVPVRGRQQQWQWRFILFAKYWELPGPVKVEIGKNHSAVKPSMDMYLPLFALRYSEVQGQVMLL
jgi:hypothetical protein